MKLYPAVLVTCCLLLTVEVMQWNPTLVAFVHAEAEPMRNAAHMHYDVGAIFTADDVGTCGSVSPLRAVNKSSLPLPGQALDLHLRWSAELGSASFAPPLILDLMSDGRKEIVVPTFTHYVEALDGETGRDVFSWPFTHPRFKSHASPIEVDVDSDGTVEVMVATHHGELLFFQEDGALKRGATIHIGRIAVPRAVNAANELSEDEFETVRRESLVPRPFERGAGGRKKRKVLYAGREKRSPIILKEVEEELKAPAVDVIKKSPRYQVAPTTAAPTTSRPTTTSTTEPPSTTVLAPATTTAATTTTVINTTEDATDMKADTLTDGDAAARKAMQTSDDAQGFEEFKPPPTYVDYDEEMHDYHGEYDPESYREPGYGDDDDASNDDDETDLSAGGGRRPRRYDVGGGRRLSAEARASMNLAFNPHLFDAFAAFPDFDPENATREELQLQLSRKFFGLHRRSPFAIDPHHSRGEGDPTPFDATQQVLLEPHILATPVVADLDFDGSFEVIVPVSYYLEAEDLLAAEEQAARVADATKSINDYDNSYADSYAASAKRRLRRKQEQRGASEQAPKDPKAVPGSGSYMYEGVDPDMYVVSEIHAIELSTGKLKWRRQIESSVKNKIAAAYALSTPTVVDLDGDRFFEIVVTATSGQIYVLDHNGNPKRSAAAGTPDAKETRQYRWPSGVFTFYAPALVEDVNGDGELEIVTADAASQVTCWDRFGNIIWQKFGLRFSVAGGLSAGDVDGDGTLDIVIGTTGGQIYALKGTTGEVLPRFPIQVGDVGSDIARAHAASGNPLSKADVSASIVAPPLLINLNDTAPPHAEDAGRGLHIVVPATDGRVYVVSGTTGCYDSVDVGHASYNAVLADDLAGNGKMALVVTTVGGTVHVIETQAPYDPLKVTASRPVGMNGMTAREGFVGIAADGPSRALRDARGESWKLSFTITDRRPNREAILHKQNQRAMQLMRDAVMGSTPAAANPRGDDSSSKNLHRGKVEEEQRRALAESPHAHHREHARNPAAAAAALNAMVPPYFVVVTYGRRLLAAARFFFVPGEYQLTVPCPPERMHTTVHIFMRLSTGQIVEDHFTMSFNAYALESAKYILLFPFLLCMGALYLVRREHAIIDPIDDILRRQSALSAAYGSPLADASFERAAVADQRARRRNMTAAGGDANRLHFGTAAGPSSGGGRGVNLLRARPYSRELEEDEEEVLEELLLALEREQMQRALQRQQAREQTSTAPREE